MPPFEGIWVPMVTPFRNGFVDVNAAQQLAVDLVGAGIDGLVLCGTTGEASTLDVNEQETLLCTIHEAVGSICPIVMGISGSCTRTLAEKVRDF
jgi:4-hydroxy-tetrahydrodipicolinate synthase